jgi:protein-tyrosine kinase
MSTLERALAKAKLAGEKTVLSPRGASQLGRVTRVAHPPAQGPHDAVPDATARPGSDRHVQVDRAALRQVGLMAPESQEWRVVEEYRQIKRPLLAKAAGRAGLPIARANLVAVSSAVPGEGKTFTCINLAISIARERDWSVLLVDGDVAKPHVTGLFGLDTEPGLLDFLRDPDTSIDKCVIATDIPGLSILPAGRRDDYTDELLASDRMDQFLQYLADSNPRRLVLFDTSPLLAATQSALLASHMAQIVVVVKAGSTTHEQVLHAIAKLDPEKAIGLVLNQAQLGADRLAYGGEYGYGYGYNDGSQGESVADEAGAASHG